ncbi:hypothetical protein N0V82_006046 [Gnomoniopsis sp. IMI 355080]|nr:hypothetical protein N0V82_006046 [Gnomoniopsis sp. IMI 355080]
MDALMAAGEEGVFVLNPALATPCVTSVKQKPDKPTFIEGLLPHNQKAHGQISSPSGPKDDHFLYDGEDDDDQNEHQRLLNPTVSQPQQVNATLCGPPSKLLQKEIYNTGGSSGKPPMIYPHENSMESPMPAREALFPPTIPTGCVVTIHNLPCDISTRDVLSRVSGGELHTATLLKVKNAMCAVITFKEARSAELFVHASESFSDEIWTFSGREEDSGLMKAQIAYAPHLDTDKLFIDPANIPIEPRFSMEVDLATRCLAITNCSFKLIEDIWKAFNLSEHLCIPHYTNQFEDIWLDGFQRGRAGCIDFATLHIWYTNTNMALGAKQRFAGRYWSKSMQFEADPCDNTPAVLFFRPSNDPGFAWHSNPNHSLLNVFRAGRIGELFRTWREITDTVNKSRLAPPHFQEGPKLLPSEDIAARREAARTNGGFDPVTLLSVSVQDYDSDEDGGRAPPRLDVRKIEAQQATTRKIVLPSPNAWVTTLETLAGAVPSTYIHSPGTYTAMMAFDSGLIYENEYPDGFLDEFKDDACNNSVVSSGVQSREADDVKKSPRRYHKKSTISSKERFVSLKKAFKEPHYWYTVSLAEFLACNEQQHKAMGTVFYVPPEGHNSLEKHPWK